MELQGYVLTRGAENDASYTVVVILAPTRPSGFVIQPKRQAMKDPDVTSPLQDVE
ncbi:hypothetical protein CGLO_02198 [Colletotrichum gloeosporioides Cg-14]|uniref:Uncharacterized protein n=1 Tax=Colletotrichum gloeosporioides (strain Cg-14) TaxID=1237896 RepID=T0KZK8_COLGC|nr:hypothetical protein CGLO_02198 [Colletotrichum gloeosporioides Cg-14]